MLTDDEKRQRKAEVRRRWHLANPDKVKANKARYLASPGGKKKRAEYARRWRAENPGKAREVRRRWYERNADTARKLSRDWIAANPEYNRMRQAVRRGAVGKFTGIDLQYARVLRFDPCAYCGDAGGTVDHMTAALEGGTNEWMNLTAACRSCNARKRHLSPLLALLRIGGMTISEPLKMHVQLGPSEEAGDDIPG